jgi:hypothetical protein
MKKDEKQFGFMLGSLQDESFVNVSQCLLNGLNDISMTSMATLTVEEELLYSKDSGVLVLDHGYIHLHLINTISNIRLGEIANRSRIEKLFGRKSKLESFTTRLLYRICADFANRSSREVDKLIIDTCAILARLIGQGMLDPEQLTNSYNLLDYACRNTQMTRDERKGIYKTLLSLDDRNSVTINYVGGNLMINPRDKLQRTLIKLSDCGTHQGLDENRSYMDLLRQNATQLIDSIPIRPVVYEFVIRTLTSFSWKS